MLVVGNGFLGKYLAYHLNAQTFGRHNAEYIGDVRNIDDLKKAVSGHDVIIYTVGFAPTKIFGHGVTLEGIKNIVRVTNAKIIFISAAGAGSEKSNPYLRLKGECEDYLYACDNDIQILRPSILAEPGNVLLDKLKNYRGILPYFPMTLHPNTRKDVLQAIITSTPLINGNAISSQKFLKKYTRAYLFSLPKWISKISPALRDLVYNDEL